MRMRCRATEATSCSTVSGLVSSVCRAVVCPMLCMMGVLRHCELPGSLCYAVELTLR